jgi:hypothetical protein
LLVGTLDGLAKAQTGTLAKAKDLYTSASYEAALVALADDEGEQAQQYRALCLLALGRNDDARSATEALVTRFPGFTTSEQEVPRRFVTLLNETRRKVLPAVIRQLFAEGRERFQAQSYDESRQPFQEVLKLANDPLVKGTPETTDLALLASGFLDLASAQALRTTRPAISPAATPASVAPPVIKPPVAIRQVVPSWNFGPANSTVTVRLKVLVGVDGRVKSATIETPTRPQYDLQLLTATKSWLYSPGTLNGEPLPMEKMVSLAIVTH